MIKATKIVAFSLMILLALSVYALAGTISGTVTDNTGLPLEGIWVSLLQDDDYPNNGGDGVTVTMARREPSSITISGRQIFVNGDPFIIKGVGYSPVPIGHDPETTPPYGDYFTPEYNSIYDRDLLLLREMGANTIRLWGWNNIANHLDFLDKAYNNGVNPIYVIVGFWINAGLDIDPDSPDNVREELKADFREMVAAHKNHPAILMWVIGNELNAEWMYGGDLDDLFSLMNEMAEEAHAEEGTNYHPVTTPLLDSDIINTIETYDASIPSLDIWGANVYRGNTFGSLFCDYETISDKPLVILEYGIDAYDNNNGEEYENIGTPYQAEYAEALWKEIVANSNICIGSSIMAYSDEWWKGKHSTDSDCQDDDPSHQSNCGYLTTSHPDGYANEEWWGIMQSIKDSSGGIDIMEPRAVYYRLHALWLPSDISIDPTSVNFGSIYVGNTSAAQTFSVTNTGNTDLVIGTLSITGTNASEFSIQNDNCSLQTIAPSGTCTLDVVFSPTSPGTKTANLSIQSNDPDTPIFDAPISGVGIITYGINLDSGWNLISLPLTPADTSTETVLTGIANSVVSVWTYDQTNGWRSYFPGQLGNDLTEMTSGKGYWVNTTSSEAISLNVTGSAAETAITLDQGWNVVGYGGADDAEVSTSLSGLDYISIWAYDQTSGWTSNFKDGQGNDLLTLEKGRGYWINMNQSATWNQ